ncbi:hypothetical protein ACPCIR_05590 [Mycobacterium sp. NPDC051198]
MPPDQSKVFFPGTVQTYGLDLTPTDRDHLAELYALRQIDPCGFVDRKALEDNDHKDFSYTYTAVPWIETGGNSPIATLGGDGCTIAFPANKMGLELAVRPGESRWNDPQFKPDPAHPGVINEGSPPCTFRVALPLTRLPGAPASMRDPMLEVSAAKVTDGQREPGDPSLCDLGGTIAGNIAALVEQRGVPVYSDGNSYAARFLTADPCDTAQDLPAVGFIWKEPNPQAQWPTTWRHPGVCNLQLDKTGGAPATAVVKHGLVKWSDSVLDMPWGEDPERSERDGTELFDFSSYLAPGCFVIAKTGQSIEPVGVGTGAPDLSASTPVVTVRLNATAGENCGDMAKQVALAGVQRAR